MQSSQAKILEYCIKNSVFDGWNSQLLEDASKSAGLAPDYWQILFPAGVIDVLDFWVNEANKKMLKDADLKSGRTPDKIRSMIKARFEAEQKNKEALKSALGVYVLHPLKGTEATYRIVDTMWNACGDKSTDWNYYSKRMLLAGVYTSTLLYWLNDTSDNDEQTWQFLDKRLADVASFGKLTSGVKDLMKGILPKHGS